jgi:hypothetical protein
MQTDMLIGSRSRHGVFSNIKADRLFYPLMCILFLGVAVVGFWPRSAAIIAGSLPNPPLVTHIHAATMAIWMVLLAVQGSLVAAGQRKLHMTLGMLSLLLVALMLVLMPMATFATYRIMTAVGVGEVASNLLLLQIRAFVLFPLFLFWGLREHKHNRQAHKRLMLFSTLILLDAAVARMDWLPGNSIESTYAMAFFYQLLLLVPALVYDQWRTGRIHTVYYQALAIYLPFIMLTLLLWNNPIWHVIAQYIMGF